MSPSRPKKAKLISLPKPTRAKRRGAKQSTDRPVDTVQTSNDYTHIREWANLKEQIAKINEHFNANILVLAHFPSENKSSNYISGFGNIACQFQSRESLTRLAKEFSEECLNHEEARHPNGSTKIDPNDSISQVAQDGCQVSSSFSTENHRQVVPKAGDPIKMKAAQAPGILQPVPQQSTLATSPLKIIKKGSTEHVVFNGKIIPIVRLTSRPVPNLSAVEPAVITELLPESEENVTASDSVDEAEIIITGEVDPNVTPYEEEIVTPDQLSVALQGLNGEDGFDADAMTSLPSVTENAAKATERRGRPKNPGSRRNRLDPSTYRYPCDECNKSFRDNHDLRVHKRKHTGEKPFTCDECGQSFTLKCTLKVHYMSHTGERPFSCSLCDLKFSRADYLTRHMSVHTGEKPFDCPVESCGRKFPMKSRLNRHLLVMHKIKV